ncbi:hypothetical protein DRP04_10385 [Archaeoglobales archaeon]|nr:MAG: hypothetical protein DRP04_10385 [Archaeoglobales archaeon]
MSGVVVWEGDYVRIWDLGSWWCIEDKTLLNYPIVSQGETKTAARIYMEFTKIEGKLVPVRTYYLKTDFPYEVVERTALRLEKKRKKEFERLRRYLGYRQ